MKAMWSWKSNTVACAIALGLVAAGCGGSPSGTDGGMTGTDAGMTTTDAGMTADAGMDAGTPAPMNHSFDTATAIKIDAKALTGKLQDTNTANYYTFMGTAGARLMIGTVTAASNGSTSAVDTVVTLYDANKNQIAQDDDAWPRFNTDSTLFTQLPSTGTYYIAVMDCLEAFGSMNCAPASQITDLAYQVIVANTTSLPSPEVNAGTAQDGTTAKAVAVPYAIPSNAMGQDYGLYVLDGTFKSAGETHVFSFTPPADTKVDASTAIRANFWVQPMGTMNGDGSTSNVKLWVTDSSGTKILGEVDQSNYKDGDNATNGPIAMSVPVTLGQQYYLFVQNEDASPKSTDYYFIEHYEGTFQYGTPEVEPNDTAATAQVLAVPSTVTMGTPAEYFAAGTLSSAGETGDTDWYEVDPSSGATTVSAFCSGERAGSGLRGLTIGLYTLDSMMNPVAIASATGMEVANADLNVPMINVPAGASKVYMKVTATSQDAMVTGNYYTCGVVYQ